MRAQLLLAPVEPDDESLDPDEPDDVLLDPDELLEPEEPLDKVLPSGEAGGRSDVPDCPLVLEGAPGMGPTWLVPVLVVFPPSW